MQVTIPVIRQNHRLRLHELKSELMEQGVSLEDVPSGMVLRFMGEPSYNENTNLLLYGLAPFKIHPVIETRLPKDNEHLRVYINCATNMLNESYKGTEGTLKFHIGSTSEKERKARLGGVMTLTELGKLISDHLPPLKNEAKFVLVLDKDAPIDPKKLTRHFNPVTTAIELADGNDQPALAFTDAKAAIRQAGFELYDEPEAWDGGGKL